MKKRILFILVVAFAFIQQGHSQEDTTLESQFSILLDKSNRYQEYKVLKITELNKFQKSITDSVAAFQQLLSTNRSRIGLLESHIDSLQSTKTTLQNELALSQKKEQGMDVFGTIINKTTYQLIVWTLVGVLVFLVLILFFKFKSSNSITKEVKSKLKEIETELETHRQRALEREQQLRRKLQDEINKQKKG